MSNTIIPDRIGVATAEIGSSGNRVTGSSEESSAIVGLRPLHDRVLVRRDSASSETAGGIVIPEVGKEKPLRGTVVAVGPGKKDASGVFHETMVRPGDAVLFSGSVNLPYVDIFQDGDLVMMAEADILGVLESGDRRDRVIR